MAKKTKKIKEQDWEHIGDEIVKERNLVKTAKFDWKYVDVAARWVAAGFEIKDLAFLFGVAPCTLEKWKQRYPEFKKACKEGTQIAVNHLAAKGLRAAGGYDYREKKQEYEITYHIDEETGEEIQTKRLVKETVQDKHQSANAYLLQFFLTNLAPQYFQDVRKVEVNMAHNVKLSVSESEAIQQLAGKLSSLGADVVDADFEEDKHKPSSDGDLDFEIS